MFEFSSFHKVLFALTNAPYKIFMQMQSSFEK